MRSHREADPGYESLISGNKWHDREDFDAFVTVIKRLSEEPRWENGSYAEGSNRWSWARNTSCKYVCLRIDMRDGGFNLTDDQGERISLKMLAWQYGRDTAKERSSDEGA